MLAKGKNAEEVAELTGLSLKKNKQVKFKPNRLKINSLAYFPNSIVPPK